MTPMKLTRPPFAASLPTAHPFSRMQAEIQRLFDGALGDFGTPSLALRVPPLDVQQDSESVTVSLELPGMKRDDFEISLHDGVLSIAGERRFEEKRQKVTAYRAERFEGRFERTVRLPKAVQGDKVSATYRDGILTVVLPIAAEAKARQIRVGSE